MVQARRRVSYIIPSPSDSPSFAAGSQPGYSVPPPRLLLPPLGVPRHGVPGPLLIPHPSNSSSSSPWSASSSPTYTSSRQDGSAERYGQQHPQARHPRHRLGVACLALDASTLLVGKDTPEGILYTGGRDGMVMAWDLGVPMQRRKSRNATDPSAGGANARTATGSGAASPETAGSGSSAGSSRNASSDDLSPNPHRRRRKRTINRWEVLTGWEDDALDSEEETEGGGAHQQGGSDGDVLGDVVSSAALRRKRRRGNGGNGAEGEDEIPYESRWETDLGKFQAGTRTKFRQCSQAHTDWVNDIVLCNYNQTLVSASSDGTVKAWSPHSSTPADPVKIGMHADYVRCLAYCREQHWVASGSFDRTIKLWDLTRSSPSDQSQPSSNSSSYSYPHINSPPPKPLTTLSPPDPSASSPKSSIYALHADPSGRLIASGGPERVVRLWDPRSGKRTAKMVGHTDMVRCVVGSEDGRYLLTGSSDASIKLWSLLTQKCLHTFTHHTDSVWALFSSHPSLEVFYSGDRSGLVCRVDVEGVGVGPETVVGGYQGGYQGYGDGMGGGGDVGEGECVVLCNDSLASNGEDGGVSGDGAQGAGGKGIHKILVMDDNLLWTASGTSSVRRWYIPQRRSVRVANALATGAPLVDSPTEVERPTAISRSASTPPSDASRASSTTGHGHGHSNSLSVAYTHSLPHSSSFTQTHSRRMSASPSINSLASDLNYTPNPNYNVNAGHLSPPLVPGIPQSQAQTTLSPTACVAGVPFTSLVKLVSPNVPFGFGLGGVAPSISGTGYGSYGYTSGYAGAYGGPSGYGPSNAMRGGRDADVATLYSAASVMSMPRHHSHGAGGYGRQGVQNVFTGRSGSPPLGSPLGQGQAHSGGVSTSKTEDTIMLSASQPSASASHSHLHPLVDPQLSLAPTSAHPLSAYPLPPDLPELASDATPLLASPDFVIPGSHGLVRSVILNDRIHALTVDTAGVVGVWDVVRGVCRGVWGAGDVVRLAGGGAESKDTQDEVVVLSEDPDGAQAQANQDHPHLSLSPRDALDLVRARIEGEGVAPTWCSADTRGGVLTIHVGAERGFDAEVYVDEVGFDVGGGGDNGEEGFTEESKLNIGKWVLKNLFIDFIEEELRLHPPPASSSPSGSASSRGAGSGGGRHPQSHSQSRPHTPQQRSVGRAPSRDTLDRDRQDGSGGSNGHGHGRYPTITPENAGLYPPGSDVGQAQSQSQSTSSRTPPPLKTTSTSDPLTPPSSTSTSSTIISSPDMIPAVPPSVPTPVRASPLVTPLIPLHVLSRESVGAGAGLGVGVGTLPSIPQSPVAVTPGAGGLSASLPAGSGIGAVGAGGSNDAAPTLGSAPPPSSFHLPGLGGSHSHQRSRSSTVDGSMGVGASSATPTPIMTSGLGTAGLVTPSVGGGKEDYFSLRMRRPSVTTTGAAAGGAASSSAVPQTPDDFAAGGTGSKGDTAQQLQQPQTPLLPPPPTPQTPSTPSSTSGLMSRLKSFGKIAKARPVSEVPALPTSSVGSVGGGSAALATPAADTTGGWGHTAFSASNPPQLPPNAVQKILQSSPHLTPPPSHEAPLHPLPPSTTIIISEEAQPSYNVLYRREVGRLREDVAALEEAMPGWLAEYLLLGKVPMQGQQAKISFVLMPWRGGEEEEVLPELLNTQQSKLTASRYLRVKKIVYHVQDKLERIAMASGTRSGTNSIRSSMDSHHPHAPHPHSQHPHSQQPQQHQQHERPRAEDEYEILCNDVVLPLGMSLAAVRQYVWRQGTELVMHYRRKRDVGGGPGVRAHM